MSAFLAQFSLASFGSPVASQGMRHHFNGAVEAAPTRFASAEPVAAAPEAAVAAPSVVPGLSL